ncbi:hypothetical protein JF290_17360 [Sedimentitalea sp. CAU 1593]|uniref:Pilus assembly protein PilP n=1 Tax=Sedimentitalea arenosa TaxID=2798803 RepID=A0A8J7JCB6_9RHOB|nr:hypothetical protein [Arenibacterium arenosum]
MANPSDSSQTPASVGDIATQRRALQRGDLELIGLFGPTNDLSALLRKPGGGIARVKAGDKLSAGQVIAIDESGLVLEKNGRTRRLSLPSG